MPLLAPLLAPLVDPLPIPLVAPLVDPLVTNVPLVDPLKLNDPLVDPLPPPNVPDPLPPPNVPDPLPPPNVPDPLVVLPDPAPELDPVVLPPVLVSPLQAANVAATAMADTDHRFIFERGRLRMFQLPWLEMAPVARNGSGLLWQPPADPITWQKRSVGDGARTARKVVLRRSHARTEFIDCK
jgi:hypothetical protein